MTGDSIAELQAALADRYAIERELGRGGMAVVYLARDLRHDRRVAVKLLRPELAAAVGSLRFLREIRLAARLQHPNILPLFDSGEAAGRVYYVMPYLEGESLRAQLDRVTQLPLDQALQITRDVAEGLGHAHAQGVVHRDIKPENILLTGGRAVVADFGIARALSAAGEEQLTESGLVVGTPLYMSPEQATGEAQLDGRSDLYSLGCVLYEMLIGEPPFTGPSNQAILARMLDERPRSLRVVRPTIPAHVEQAVERVLAKVPADRFATAAQFAAALVKPGLDVPVRRTTRALVLPALVALGLTGIGIAAWQRLSRPRPASATLDPRRIAVLYFEDLSAGGTLRHVANGLTENLIDELGRVAALRVISPAGVRPYSGRTIPLDSVARALSVGSMVEGSVERPNGKLRVRVRLIEAASGAQLQSETLERPWGDLFTLQGEIAGEVARFLRQRLGAEVRLRERRAATRSVEAWEMVRRAEAMSDDARELRASGHLRAASRLLTRADSMLARAEPLDPHWAEPIVQRGWLAKLQADIVGAVSLGGGRPEHVEAPALRWSDLAWTHRAIGHAERAVQLNPRDALALQLRGHLRLSLWASQPGVREGAAVLRGAEEDLRAAVATDPTLARAWSTLGEVLYHRGEFAQASVTLERALEADAYLEEAASNIQLLMFAALERGDSGAASALCATGRARFAGGGRFTNCEIVVLGWVGSRRQDGAQAWRLLQDIERGDSAALLVDTGPFRRMMVAAVLARAGLADSAKRVMRAARASAPNPALLRGLELYEAYVHTLLNENDTALQLLTKYLHVLPEDRTYVRNTRWFRPLRADRRFQALVGAAAAADSSPTPSSP